MTILLILGLWWPLVEAYFAFVDWSGEWWRYIDWLLIGIFAFMSITIIARAALKADLLIILVGLCGGLAIESWGTQTDLWHYYTDERPPLWIIPAWPIASLSIDRMTRFLDWLTERTTTNLQSLFSALYWIIFVSFLSLMLIFVAPTFDKSFTWLALLLCILLILTPIDHRFASARFSQVLGLDIIWSSGALRVNAGRITLIKRRRSLLSLRTGWLRSSFGEREAC